jgi:23S rRNA pseudouridine2605 synthase
MRLNAFLAKAGLASRRGADDLIKSGRVKVNERPGQLNDHISEDDIVKIDDKQVKLRKSRYILLHKPAGYITTLKDPHGRRKVADLIDVEERIVPVGRLDYDTTGALLLTNDGELAHKLMHPSFEVDKVYEAEVIGEITDDKLKKLQTGIKLHDGLSAPAKTKKINENSLELTLHEGRNHQVKRMLAAVELRVKHLHRRQYGPLTLDSLKPGQWRDLSSEELDKLKSRLSR